MIKINTYKIYVSLLILALFTSQAQASILSCFCCTKKQAIAPENFPVEVKKLENFPTETELRGKLLNAVAEGQLETVKHLVITYGQDTEARQALGIANALGCAASKGHLEIVKHLVTTYAQDTEARQASVISNALGCAASKGHLEIVKHLVTTYGQGAEAIQALGIANALGRAASNGHLETVKHLVITYGQGTEAIQALGIANALCYAADKGRLKIVEYLVATYGQYAEIIEQEFLNERLKCNFLRKNCFIHAIINLQERSIINLQKQQKLVKIITQPTEYLVQLYKSSPNENLKETLQLLQQATSLRISNDVKLFKTAQMNIKKLKICQKKLANVNAALGVKMLPIEQPK